MPEWLIDLANVPVSFVIIWIAGWILTSVIYRKSVGKPILVSLEKPEFIKKSASGYSYRTWYTKIGGASRCLIVAVKDGKLIIRPRFPFNLMFLPEITDLEHEIPFAKIETIDFKKSLLSKRLEIQFRNKDNEQTRVSLIVKNPDALFNLLPKGPRFQSN